MSLYRDAVKRCKRRLLLWALSRAYGNMSRASRRLGVNRTTVQRLVAENGIEPGTYRKR